MALSFSLSAEAFAQHSHLLDGAIGRTFAYLSIGLLLGLKLWLQLGHAIPHQKQYRWVASTMAFSGAFLALNGIYWQAADPFALDLLAPTLSLRDFGNLMLHSTFGQSWVLFCLLVFTAAVYIHAKVSLALLTGSIVVLAASGHAGEQGLTTWQMWIAAIHTFLALLWLGAFAILAIGRIGNSWVPGLAVLQQFSSIALPVFSLILIAGLVRMGLLYFSGEEGLDPLYLVMLGIKLGAVLGVMASAWHLRKLLRAAPGEAGHFSDESYNGGLSLELFCATVLIFATAMLTQLPPI